MDLNLGKCKQSIVSANGESISILGTVDLCIYVGRVGKRQTILVAKDLAQSCILGVDLMRANGLIIDCNSMLLKSKEENVPLKT